MTKTRRGLRPLAALLALVMALSLAPIARADAVACKGCGSVNGDSTQIQAGTCTQAALYEYICKNEHCALKGISQLITGEYNFNNHDAVYTDNGDGTHSGVCSHHTTPVTVPPESHTYSSSGACTRCGAINYTMVELNPWEKTRTVPVALGDANAKLSAGDIRLTLGSADITDDYDLGYLWYYRGSLVGSSAEYALPASVYDTEGVYYYTLIVSAVPRGSLSRQPVTNTCTVTVSVEERITASATVTTEDEQIYLGEEDRWSAYSVSSQIYEAVQDLCARGARPSYVVFAEAPSTAVGRLDVSVVSRPFYFETASLTNALDNVRFYPAAAGDYVVGFTAYDTDGKDYAGVLTITVQQDTGNMDVVYTTARNTAVTFSPDDFESFWAKSFPNGLLDYVAFIETPKTTEGALYVDYTSAALPGTRLRTSDAFYVEPTRHQYGIDAVSFLPGVKQTEYVSISFMAYGTRNNGRPTSLEGTLYIFLSSDGKQADIAVSAASGGTALNPSDFQKAYTASTGSPGSSFFIQLLDVPASGSLYLGRTAVRDGVRLTQATVSGRPFSYSDSRGETISSLTYVPGALASESIRYVACSAQGKPLYAGRIVFTAAGTGTTPGAPSASGLLVNYSSTAAGVSFRSSDFETLPGAGAAKLTIVSFTPPAATAGSLYFGRTAAEAGTRITSSNSWFSVSSTLIAGANRMDSITFVPAAGTSGVVTIPFTAMDANNTQVQGTVRITVSAASTSNPTTPVTPAKTFPDVAQNAYYYQAVTELTTSGVLGGFDDGTFRPDEPVKLGQALKMIMIAAGYPDLSGTGSDWAKPFLERAKQDGLLPANASEDLDKNVNRYTIAEIAARAMGLSLPAVTVSPFADMTTSVSSAPYVMALYNIGIIMGSTDKSGRDIYQGTYAIKRCDFAIIIWRMQHYVKTGSVSGTAS